jgi:hypothetical protein
MMEIVAQVFGRIYIQPGQGLLVLVQGKYRYPLGRRCRSD